MTAIIDKYGKVLHIMQGSAEVVALNTPVGCRAVIDPPDEHSYYDNGWKALPPKPHAYAVFDYPTRKYIDPRTLDQAKESRWQELKTQRDSLEFGGFEYAGHIYDSDQVSQGRITGAALAGVDQVWTLANNDQVELSAAQLGELYRTLQAHVSNLHERGRIAREKIYQAASIYEVYQVDL